MPNLSCAVGGRVRAQVFACTVGQKPSRAPFYLNEPQEVLHLLARLVGLTWPHQHQAVAAE